jgi:hypothetical protein
MVMAEMSWTIEGREFVHCNCAYGCPCQFNALPTHGNCQAVAAIEIERGHHGETRLDGLNIGMVVSWPGPIHEGGGEVVPIVDERASPAQREALLRIMSGEDTEPGATLFSVFAATFDKVHDPVFATVDFEVDIDERTARVSVPGLIEARGEPIRNAVTGEPSRAQIVLPEGFEYHTAEIGRGWAKTKGPVVVSLADCHGQFAHLHMTQSGIVH